MRRLVMGVGASLAAFGASAGLVLALEQTSPNYRNVDPTTIPATFNVSSASYQVNASVESITGYSGSANFNIHHGTPFKEIVPVTPTTTPPGPGGGGGGGGGGFSGTPATTTPTTTIPSVPVGKAKPPTLVYRSPTFLSKQTVGGNYTDETASVSVNGSASGVNLMSNLFWNRELPLFVGYNEIRVQITDKDGLSSDIIYGTVERMLVGDASREIDKGTFHIVDDVDLSRFTRAWKTYSFFSDFNEDGKIDDADLSLLASHWGKTATY
jgi:hypothetical protein